MFKPIYLVLLTIFGSGFIFAQNSRFQLIDELNDSPVKYANVKAIISDFGVSSDSLGYFEFDKNQDILINAVGYELKQISLKNQVSQIKLTKKPLPIEEVVVLKRKGKNELVVGHFDTSEIKQFYGMSGDKNGGWIIGKYFENKFYKTRFLKSITVYTVSEVRAAKFNIRLYKVDKNGNPESEIYSENILGIAKKGSKKTQIDLSITNVTIPENGIFIAVDWLKIEENVHEYTYTMKGEKGKKKGQSYSPSFGTVLDNNSRKTLILMGRDWIPSVSDMMKESSKFCSLAMELVLED